MREVTPRQLTFPQQFAGTQLYSWLEKGTVKHNTVSLARAWTRTAQSADERTNHEATVRSALV